MSTPESKDWSVYVRRGLQLPLRDSPIKFAVTMPDGCTSNAWRVWTERREAYVCCRDDWKQIKISLHRSGKQHIAFRQETGLKMTPDSRFWNQWREPPQQNPAIPSFQLVFPPWGVRLTGADREKTQKKWADNQILLKGDDERMVVVSFVILDKPKRLKYEGENPQILIGELPFGDGKTLFVVAGKVPEENLREIVERGLSKISRDDSTTVLGTLIALAKGDVPAICMTGDNPEGYAYMVSVPVRARIGKNMMEEVGKQPSVKLMTRALMDHVELLLD